MNIVSLWLSFIVTGCSSKKVKLFDFMSIVFNFPVLHCFFSQNGVWILCTALSLLLFFFRLIRVSPQQSLETWLSLHIHGQDCLFGVFMLEKAMLSILEWEVRNWNVTLFEKKKNAAYVLLLRTYQVYFTKLYFMHFLTVFPVIVRWEHDTESLPRPPSTNCSKVKWWSCSEKDQNLHTAHYGDQSVSRNSHQGQQQQAQPGSISTGEDD